MDEGKISRSLFDINDRAEILDEENFPGERLIEFRNQSDGKHLDTIVALTERKLNPLCGEDDIGLAIGQEFGKHNMKMNFELTITENSCSYESSEFSNLAEAELDGSHLGELYKLCRFSGITKVHSGESKAIGI